MAGNVCPECGAALPPDGRCRDLFEACLVKDFEHPRSYGSVHHLIVATYMLQHNGYSRPGWLAARGLVAEAIASGKVPDIRSAGYKEAVSSRNRRFSFTRGEKILGLEGVTWSRTVADVRLGSAEDYC